jgi:hypothetical protein
MAGERHELEIVIDKQGRVTVEVKGAKGPACLEYEELFAKNVGRVKRKQLTQEYYEPPSQARIVESERTRARRGPTPE